MNLQQNIFGENLYEGTTRQEIEQILTKFPAAQTNTGLFYFQFLMHRCPFIAQWPEERKNELRDACRSLESARRRKQQICEEDRKAARLGS